MAAAAYRAGENLVNERTGLIHNFSRRSGVDFEQIIGFDGSRSELWNLAEVAEKRKDGTPAREYEIALPRELTRDQNIELAMSYGQWLRREHGCAVDVCVHDLDSKNPHAHILTTTREATGRDLGAKVAREWSDTRRKKAGLPGRKSDLKKARVAWEKIANFALEKYGHEARIDHRSLADQGVDRAPQIHIGAGAMALERKGIVTGRGSEAVEIEEANREHERTKRAKAEQKKPQRKQEPTPTPEPAKGRKPAPKKPVKKAKKPKLGLIDRLRSAVRSALRREPDAVQTYDFFAERKRMAEASALRSEKIRVELERKEREREKNRVQIQRELERRKEKALLKSRSTPQPQPQRGRDREM